MGKMASADTISTLDKVDKQLINSLQGGFPICDNPYQLVANELGISETDLISRLGRLRRDRILSRFGPMYDIQKLGGAFSLCTMRVAEKDFTKITELVNSYPEVAHNYKRNHEFNMWFVLATETPEQIQQCCDRISEESGIKVYNMPKLKEFFVGLHFTL
ncbi:MAG: Lrp/AsnC family transcriptional regulator [Pseudomonadota bacterium]